MFLLHVICVYILSVRAEDIENKTFIKLLNESTTDAPVIPCSSDEWSCADGGCVGLHQKCDGVINCSDGSDEILKQCSFADRELLGIGIHCSSPWCSRYPGVCPDICCRQPEFCYYALFADAESPNSCILPDFPKNGSYSVEVKEAWDGVVDSVLVDFSLMFECDYGTVLVGDFVNCENGTWTAEFPYCSDACKLNKIPGYQYTCQDENFSYSCGDYVAINSTVYVEKDAEGKSGAQIFCTADKIFNTSTECVEELNTRQKTFETETLSEIEKYEDKFSKSDNRSYEFQELVANYYTFHGYVTGNSSELNRTAEACGIYLDLLENEISLNIKNNKSSTETAVKVSWSYVKPSASRF